MAHEYGRRHGTVGPWMRNLWDKLPDLNLGGLSPSYGQFAPQTREEYEAQRNRPMFNPTVEPGRASLRQVAGDIAGAGQAGVPGGYVTTGGVPVRGVDVGPSRAIPVPARDVGGWPGRGRGETDVAMMQRIREAQPSAEYGYPMALSRDEWGMYGQAQKDIAAGKYAEEEEDDDMQKLLRYMFMSELMAGMQGGDPPTPYTVQAGPAARAFPTMPSM